MDKHLFRNLLVRFSKSMKVHANTSIGCRTVETGRKRLLDVTRVHFRQRTRKGRDPALTIGS